MRPAWFLLAAVATALLVPVWIRWASRHGVADPPGRRRLHALATPRGGGIVLALVLLAGVVAIDWALPTGRVPWLGLLAALAWFGLLGLVDDLAGLPSRRKLLLQAVGAVLLALALGPQWPAAPVVAPIAAFAGALAFVNVWNFMDGSNGMVAVQSLLIAILVASWPGLSEALQAFALLLAACCLGFLPFNLPQARVFLGDSGSHVLGAAVFALLVLAWRDDAPGPAQGLLLASVLLLDAGSTLLQRWQLGRNLWRPHREHLYQYAVRRGHSHLRVCLAYAAWTLLAGAVAMLLDARPAAAWLALAVLGISACGLHARLKQHWLRQARPALREVRHDA